MYWYHARWATTLTLTITILDRLGTQHWPKSSLEASHGKLQKKLWEATFRSTARSQKSSSSVFSLLLSHLIIIMLNSFFFFFIFILSPHFTLSLNQEGLYLLRLKRGLSYLTQSLSSWIDQKKKKQREKQSMAVRNIPEILNQSPKTSFLGRPSSEPFTNVGFVFFQNNDVNSRSYFPKTNC